MGSVEPFPRDRRGQTVAKGGRMHREPHHSRFRNNRPSRQVRHMWRNAKTGEYLFVAY